MTWISVSTLMAHAQQDVVLAIGETCVKHVSMQKLYRNQWLGGVFIITLNKYLQYVIHIYVHAFFFHFLVFTFLYLLFFVLLIIYCQIRWLCVIVYFRLLISLPTWIFWRRMCWKMHGNMCWVQQCQRIVWFWMSFGMVWILLQ